jgi:hypothetical protein
MEMVIALLVNVILDNEKLGGGTFNVGLGGDQATLNKEYLGREIIKVLAGNENNYKLWPIAVDVNLYSQEQGETSGVYLTLTVIVAILIAGLSLRSFYTVSIIGFGISALILWLKGISAILGIKGGLIVDFIVPIAMVSLGVDFAIGTMKSTINPPLIPKIALIPFSHKIRADIPNPMIETV